MNEAPPAVTLPAPVPARPPARPRPSPLAPAGGPVYVSQREAWEALGLSESSFERLAACGRLRGIRVRIGRGWRVHLRRLLAAADADGFDLTKD